jgi:hypothetical protein
VGEPNSGQTRVPLAVMNAGVRQRLRAAVAMKACHPLGQGAVPVGAVEVAEEPGAVVAGVVVDVAEN